jgi:hypothetical protein
MPSFLLLIIHILRLSAKDMKETFDSYKKRTTLYSIVNCVVVGFLFFVFTCILFPKVISNAPQPLMVCLFLIGSIVTLGSMFIGGSSIKTYKKDGEIVLTDSSITIDERSYFFIELLTVEVTAGMYKGKATTRGGLVDGTGNEIVMTTKDNGIVKTKFVVSSKEQRDN